MLKVTMTGRGRFEDRSGCLQFIVVVVQLWQGVCLVAAAAAKEERERERISRMNLEQTKRKAYL